MRASPVAPETWPQDAVEVGVIVDAYGLKGWVKVASHAQAGRSGNALLAVKRWWLEKEYGQKGRERRSVACMAVREQGDGLVAWLGGVVEREAALLLRGARIYVSRSEFPALLDDNEFYWVDLIGLEVVNEAGAALGRVTNMIDNGVHSILCVTYPAMSALDKGGKPASGERLIPFVDAYVKTVDQAAKRIVVDWQADY